jgi:hypothetical protein
VQAIAILDAIGTVPIAPPPICTVFEFVNPNPVIDIVVPTGPELGEME